MLSGRLDFRRFLGSPPPPREETVQGRGLASYFPNSGWYEYPFVKLYHSVGSGSNFQVRLYSDQESYWPVLSSGTGNYYVLPSLNDSYVNLSKSFISLSQNKWSNSARKETKGDLWLWSRGVQLSQVIQILFVYKKKLL